MSARVLSPSSPDVLALRETQASRALLRQEERDASWRVRGGRVQKMSRSVPPACSYATQGQGRMQPEEDK